MRSQPPRAGRRECLLRKRPDRFGPVSRSDEPEQHQKIAAPEPSRGSSEPATSTGAAMGFAPKVGDGGPPCPADRHPAFSVGLRGPGSPGCRSACRASCCSGTPSGNSWRCCSRSRPGSPGSGLRAVPELGFNILYRFPSKCKGCAAFHKRGQRFRVERQFTFVPDSIVKPLVIHPEFSPKPLPASPGKPRQSRRIDPETQERQPSSASIQAGRFRFN